MGARRYESAVRIQMLALGESKMLTNMEYVGLDEEVFVYFANRCTIYAHIYCDCKHPPLLIKPENGNARHTIDPRHKGTSMYQVHMILEIFRYFLEAECY